MCLIVLFTRCLAGCPVLLGANREEEYDRPSADPRWLGGRPDVFAGQDGMAGGTWLGVNEAGVVVAVTNRRPRSESSPADSRSRGLLCLDALRHSDAGAALEWCRGHLEDERYRPFNLLLADAQSAWVVHGGQVPQVVELPPGLHVLAEGDVDDRASGRVERAVTLGSPLLEGGVSAAVHGLQTALADADPDVEPSHRLCRRFERAGTVSGAILAVPAEGRRSGTFLYAPGPPDRRPFEDLSPSLKVGPVTTAGTR